ncbi:hypothetical protein [Candidatus Parabeggiatoa sp. HSG14]|uniref:hypothetical protein n=1 Tax=Candidatus Parabeggiatoa sp. HSG14 TaxID=3055593 RepID=UPI0025A8375B|nr:hypothetical protein [Thiotrichales bacterium HSG14]
MQAIEFTATIQDGMISIPEHYKDWFKKSVRIILLAQEQPQALPIEQDTPIEQDIWLGCMSNTGQIVGDIVSKIDDNLNCWEVLAK